MGRQPESKAQDVLNQIEDVIVSHYEEGYRYTARELRQILDSIVSILDDGCSAPAPGQAIHPALEQQKTESEPIIMAIIHSDDHSKSMQFSANRWFVVASDEEIRELARIDWGNDIEADRIAYFMEGDEPAVEEVLDYCRDLKRVSREPVGFEVAVDREQAMTWLAVHRRPLWQELKSVHG